MSHFRRFGKQIKLHPVAWGVLILLWLGLVVCLPNKLSNAVAIVGVIPLAMAYCHWARDPEATIHLSNCLPRMHQLQTQIERERMETEMKALIAQHQEEYDRLTLLRGAQTGAPESDGKDLLRSIETPARTPEQG